MALSQNMIMYFTQVIARLLAVLWICWLADGVSSPLALACSPYPHLYCSTLEVPFLNFPVPYLAMPYPCIGCPALCLLCSASPCPSLLRNALPRHALPCPAMLCPAMLCPCCLTLKGVWWYPGGVLSIGGEPVRPAWEGAGEAGH